MTLDYSPLSWGSVLYATETHLPIAVRQMPRRQVKNGLPPSVNFYHNYALEDAFPNCPGFHPLLLNKHTKWCELSKKTSNWILSGLLGPQIVIMSKTAVREVRPGLAEY
jgi:hypothetical protein